MMIRVNRAKVKEFILKTTLFTALITFVSCVSCGIDETNCDHRTNIYEEIQAGPITRARDPKITPYIQEFIKDFKGLVPDHYLDTSVLYSYRYETITPQEDGTHTIGLCYSWTFGEREIVISPSLYNTDFYQKSVIYHELAHCLFNLDHDSGDSLMNEFNAGHEAYWKANWPEELEKFKKFVVSSIKD